jgi:hypothetical protein
MPADEHVQLFARFGDFAASQGSVRLLADIGGGDRYVAMVRYCCMFVRSLSVHDIDAFVFQSNTLMRSSPYT